jgi:hypothetical protein
MGCDRIPEREYTHKKERKKMSKNELRYQVFKNTLYNATMMENNGCATLSLFRGDANNGRDDIDSELTGTLFVAPEWELRISEGGTPLFVKDDEVVPLDPVFGIQISSLQDKSRGIWYSKQISMDSLSMNDTERWKALEADFIEDL